jgi:hypothetical protein
MTTVLLPKTELMGGTHDALYDGTHGELPRAPVALFRISVFRIRIATPSAAVVNAMLMNLKSCKGVTAVEEEEKGNTPTKGT